LIYSFENREVAEKVLAEFHNVTKGGRSLNHFNRVIVLSGAVGTTFVTLLLQDLLGLGSKEVGFAR
jgi:hypothetical protein